MNSIGHKKIIEKAYNIFSTLYPNYKFDELDILINGVIDPDHINKTKGSHYAIYDAKTDSFSNRVKSLEDNAFSMLVKYFGKALITRNIYDLGFALHFVMDMFTIPHATGIKVPPLFYFSAHRKYERFTAKNMEKYFVDIKINEEFFMQDINIIMREHVDLVNSYKDKLKRKYYDEINKTFIPIILEYTVGFMYRFFERGAING